MSLPTWLYVIALIFIPMISAFGAVRLETQLSIKRQKRERKQNILRTLMATRAVVLSPSSVAIPPSHVDALNLIDIEFYGRGKKDKAVMEAWKLYLDQLNQPITEENKDRWHENRADLLADLLHKMSISLNYKFDKVLIKRAAYYPQGYGVKEVENVVMRKMIIEVLSGEKPIHVAIHMSEESKQQQNELREELLKCCKGENHVLVKNVD